MNSRNYTILNRLGAGSNPSTGESGTVVIDCPMLDEGLTAGHVRRIVEAATGGKTVMLRFSDGDGMTGMLIPTMVIDYGGFLSGVYIQMDNQVTVYMCTIDMSDDDMAMSEDMNSIVYIRDNGYENHALSISTLRQIEDALNNNKVISFYAGFNTTAISMSGEYGDKTITLVCNDKILKYRCDLSVDDGVITPEIITLGEGKPPIIDLEELPKAGWKGTAIPNTGTIRKLCFNNNLSIEEVESIISKLKLGEEFGQYIPTADSDGNNAIMIVTLGTVIGIEGIINGEDILIFSNSEEAGMGFVGFNPEITNFNFDVNYETVSEFEGIEVGNKNYLLSSFISTTPFEYVKPNVDPNSFYRTPDNSIHQLATKDVISYTGTTVNNTGTVSTVYFNDKLSLFETTKLLMKLDYVDTPFLSNPIAPLLFSSSGSPVIFAVQTYDGYEINVSTNIANGVFERIFIDYEFGGDMPGWYMNSYNVNSSVISNYQGIPVGVQNELLSSLFSITPFESSVEKVKKFKEINKPNVVYINAMSETGTLTDKEVELLKGDNTIIIAEMAVPGLATIEVIFKKAMYYDVPDMGLLLYANVSGGIFGEFDLSSVLIDLSNNTWQQAASGTIATLNAIKNIELYDDIASTGSIDLRFMDFDHMTHYLGSIMVEKQIGNSSFQNALVTHDAVKEYVDEVVGNINNALASILGEE